MSNESPTTLFETKTPNEVADSGPLLRKNKKNMRKHGGKKARTSLRIVDEEDILPQVDEGKAVRIISTGSRKPYVVSEKLLDNLVKARQIKAQKIKERAEAAGHAAAVAKTIPDALAPAVPESPPEPEKVPEPEEIFVSPILEGFTAPSGAAFRRTQAVNAVFGIY